MKISPFLVACLTLCSGIVTPGFSQETAFTYQGALQEGGSALNGILNPAPDYLRRCVPGFSSRT